MIRTIRYPAGRGLILKALPQFFRYWKNDQTSIVGRPYFTGDISCKIGVSPYPGTETIQCEQAGVHPEMVFFPLYQYRLETMAAGKPEDRIEITPLRKIGRS
jgi:hypothetical protein